MSLIGRPWKCGRYRDELMSIRAISILRAMNHGSVSGADSLTPIGLLLENHQLFLRYLERKVGSRELAEDILQDAFVKVVARPE